MSENAQERKSRPLLVLLFWLYVGIPLAWGVLSTFKQAMALFK
jgi:hypothetical protein